MGSIDFSRRVSVRRVQSLIEERDLERTLPFDTANIIDAIADHVDQPQIAESESPFHLATNWL